MQLARISSRNTRRYENQGETDGESLRIVDLARVLTIGIIGGVAGVGIGIFVNPFLRVLAPGAQLLGGISLTDAGLTLLIATSFAIASLFPAAIGFIRQGGSKDSRLSPTAREE